MKMISQGAEAKLFKDKDILTKERIKKSYRLEEIDHMLRKRRTKKEAKLLARAKRAGVLTPKIIDVDKYSIKMEFIEGSIVKDIVNKKNHKKLAELIANGVGKLHSSDIIHGDLTTSNMILKNDDLFFIDFGLGFHSSRIEDKANDIYLLRQIIESTHFEVFESFWDTFLSIYAKKYKDSRTVISTIKKIEKRGRYRKRKSD
ncbi:KEOPS complex kinase/ATPase Bud32 [Candidatus Aenigmatarchaeota archaeon]